MSSTAGQSTAGPSAGFVPPPYPYDRLDRLVPMAAAHAGGVIDLSVGTPIDAPPDLALAALSGADAARRYPASIGTPELRDAAARWIGRRFGLEVPTDQIGACVGTKEFVGSSAHLLRLRWPTRDTVLYPAISYPTYAMGAALAGCRAVPVPVDQHGALDLAAIDPDDARRAVMLWSNSPANPTGALDDLGAVARWGREHGVVVFSDECYCEFTWDSAARTVIADGTDGVVAVHSLSKRSNLAGLRVGFYAGDADVVRYLQEVRKHLGMMVPGPAQAAGVAALDDDAHVTTQRDRYRRRLERLATILGRWLGVEVELPAGGFYLWIPVTDGWATTEALAANGGALVSPGDFYGEAGTGFIRVAAVQPDDRIELLARRLGTGD